MYSIAIKEEQHESYILADESAQSRAEIVPERGGILLSWRIQGQDIFYLDAERYKNPELSVRGGNPVLFPICGNVVDDTYTVQGQTYNLKQHGFGRNLPWEVSDRATDGDARLTLTLRANEQTLAAYPFEFEAAYTYILSGKTIRIEQRHTNRSEMPMPFATGFHPYFLIPDKSQVDVAIPANQYGTKGVPKMSPFDGSFDYSQEEIDIFLRPLQAREASLSDRRRKLKISVRYGAAYSTLVFWTLQGKDFICLEPWSAPRNALNTGTDTIEVAPGATHETFVEYAVSDL
ncbi:MAG: aldose epimerase [Cyanobacteria bacterium J06641_5]